MMYISIDGEKKIPLSEQFTMDELTEKLNKMRGIGYAILYNGGERLMQWAKPYGWKNIASIK